MKIFVAKLSFDTRDNGLREAFESFGTVNSAKVIIDQYSNQSKGFGFVEMEDDDSANEAIQQLNDSQLDGRFIVVKQAEDRKNNYSNRNNNGYSRY